MPGAELEWILDTGTGNDLCPAGTAGTRIKKDTMMSIETANGIVKPDTAVSIGLDKLDEDADCVELAQTVHALSVGRRCAQHGYSFHWDAFESKPMFKGPNGDYVELTVENFVPLIKSGVRPAAGGSRRKVQCMAAKAAPGAGGNAAGEPACTRHTPSS